ncbi:uncharacterized protein LOC116340768 isoform X2 [Contarinia nasturtii]|nr:uncharacterized protein LOC116340768 isoform X2 [Contarinia nasturtii]
MDGELDMERFLGVWYQVQPDVDESEQDENEQEIPSCEFYNVTESKKSNQYIVRTVFELYTNYEEERPLKYETVSKHYLKQLDEEDSAQFRFVPPFLSGAQILESNFTIFNTDYESYAIISNCNKEINNDGDVQFAQHTTVWSRTRDFGEEFLNKLYENEDLIDFDPYNLSNVKRTGCIDARKIATISLA